jgi:hypothetical protein
MENYGFDFIDSYIKLGAVIGLVIGLIISTLLIIKFNIFFRPEKCIFDYCTPIKPEECITSLDCNWIPANNFVRFLILPLILLFGEKYAAMSLHYLIFWDFAHMIIIIYYILLGFIIGCLFDRWRRSDEKI